MRFSVAKRRPSRLTDASLLPIYSHHHIPRVGLSDSRNDTAVHGDWIKNLIYLELYEQNPSFDIINRDMSVQGLISNFMHTTLS